MNFQPARLVAALALGLSVPAFATTIEATLTRNDHAGAYSATLSNIQYAAGSTGDPLPSFSQVICIDYDNVFPSAGTTRTYTLHTDATNLIAHPDAGARATDLFNYVVDRYYDSAVVHGSVSDDTGYQFNKVLWEIATDFTGSSDSLSAGSGWIYADYLPLYDAIVNDLSTNLSTIAVGYRSSAYTVSFLDDQDGGYQSMMMLSPVAAVPEPETYALLLGGLGLLGAVARRRQSQPQG